MSMLHDLEVEDLPSTSEERYSFRLLHFKLDKNKFHRLRHYFYWLVHNCFSHLLLGLFPNNKTFEIHELTSQWLNQRAIISVPTYTPKTGVSKRLERLLIFKQPLIQNRIWWLVHNSIVHMLIGVLPIRIMFKLHDWSAKKMNVNGWV